MTDFSWIPLVMRVQQFAELFEFERQTVYGMIARRELGCLRRPGASIRILREHAVEWIGTTQWNTTSSSAAAGESGTSSTPSTGVRDTSPQDAKISARLRLLGTSGLPHSGANRTH